MMNNKRIEWVDIFKGIMIFLVVVGHATGRFNGWIYQFHMAAFFFISGYTYDIRNTSGVSLVKKQLKRMYKIIVPYVVIQFVGLVCFCFFYKMGILNSISTTEFSFGTGAAVSELFHFKFGMYCDWLGATWFMPILFLGNLIVDLLAKICKKDATLFLCSIFLFFCSMEYLLIKGGLPWNLHLAGIAQAFMIIGYIFRKLNKETDSFIVDIVKCVIIIAIWYFARNYASLTYVVDWPSNAFNGIIDLIVPMPGILCFVYISKLLAKSRYLKRCLVVFGRNSIGIMCFHFIGFKIAYSVLMLFGKMEFGEFRQLTPSLKIQDYWFLIAVIAIVFSVIVWKNLQKIYFTRVLLGGGDFEVIISSIDLVKGEFGSSIEKCYFFITDIFKELFSRIRKKKEVLLIIGSMMIVFLPVKAVQMIKMNSADIMISFPYNYDNVVFGEGWLEQGKDEEYRWVNQISEFSVLLQNQGKLHIEGFVPENVQNMSTITIYINDSQAQTAELESGQQILQDVDISQLIKENSINRIKIEFDGVRVLNEQDQDKRIFSALISNIYIQ